ncbi:MAG: hypothetical protein Kow001_22350 [Acidobacteriota bacterium]
MTESKIPVEGKSRFTHGAVYHALFDQPLARARAAVLDAVPARSRIVDIACGTGQLCYELATRKDCQVVGVDLSPRMIAFARRHSGHANVRFEIGDGADLSCLEPDSFDFATILFLLHEIPRETQVAVLNEALRVAQKAIVVDSQVPLPKNLHGLALRVVEALGGPEHYRIFADYLAGGGIGGILADSRVRATAARGFLFWHGCRHLVVLDRRTMAQHGPGDAIR